MSEEVVGQEAWRLAWLEKNAKYRRSAWIEYCLNRTGRRRNTQCLCCGSQGSGKTMHDLAACLLLDPKFTIKNVCFSAIELLERVESGELVPGSCLLLEEAAVAVSAQSWQSTETRLFSAFLETARRLQINFFLNCPSRTMLAKTVRDLMHIEKSPMDIDLRKRTVRCRSYLLQHNGLMGRTYVHKLVRKSTRSPIPYWVMPEPPEEFIRQYNEKRNAFQHELNRDILEGLRAESVNKKQAQKFTAKCQDCGYAFRSGRVLDSAPPGKCSRCQSKSTVWLDNKPEELK